MEYVIWGIPPQCREEQLLLSEFDGNKITDKLTAQKLLNVLTVKYRCKNCRIQEINLNSGFIEDFEKSVK